MRSQRATQWASLIFKLKDRKRSTISIRSQSITGMVVTLDDLPSQTMNGGMMETAVKLKKQIISMKWKGQLLVEKLISMEELLIH